MARAVHRSPAVEAYISTEVIERLRQEQHELRRALSELGRLAALAGEGPLTAEVGRFAAQYLLHERLVDALLEAVEPDMPTLHDMPDG